MASLTSQTVASSYVKLLITDSNSGLSATATNIEDGDGTASPIYLTTARVGIGTASPAVELDVTGALSISTTSSLAGTTQIGGGYGSTGITLSDAGVIQANGAMTIDGASTLTGAVTASSTVAIAGNTTIGGGYGSTGVTLTSAGVVQMNGALTVDGASTLTGAIAAGAALSVAGATTLSDDVTLPHGKKIIFDSADTYIYANTDDPEDLVIGADADIILEPDGYVGIGTSTPISALEIEAGLTTVGAVLTLGTKEPTVVANDVLGRINFYAPLDTGTDSDEIGASIAAVAQAPFSDSVNSTSLYFYTGTSEDATTVDAQMVIDEDGLVGIGIVQPTENLHLYGTGIQEVLIESSNDDAILDIEAGAVGKDSIIQFNANGDASAASIIYDHNGTPASQKMQFKTGDNAVTAATILGNGNVGIGEISPDSLLHLKVADNTVLPTSSMGGNASDQLYMENTSSTANSYNVIHFRNNDADSFIGAVYNGSDDADIVFATDNGVHGIERVRITNTGEVGIGTTDPHALLHINGGTAQIRITDSDISAANDRGLYIQQNANVAYFLNRETDKMHLGTSNSVDLTIDSAGKVGIGTQAPNAMLEVVAASSETNPVTNYTVARMQIKNSTDALSGSAIDFISDDDSRLAGIYALRTNTTGNPADLLFATNPGGNFLERMRIKGDGNVGIGEDAPDSSLHISLSGGPTIILENNSNSAITAGTDLGTIKFLGDDDSITATTGAMIRAEAKNAWGDGASANDAPTDLQFFVQSNGTNDDLGTPVMLISHDPDNSVTGGANNATALGTDVIEWEAVWAVNTTIQSSDERLKENIQDLSGSGLEKINALKARTFDWKKYKANDAELTDKGSNKIGFIAQEVQSILPEMVYKGSSRAEFSDENGKVLIPKGEESLGVAYSGNAMMAYMVKAVQELSAKVEALENA